MVTFLLAFFTVTSYSCTLSIVIFVTLLQVRKMNFLNR